MIQLPDYQSRSVTANSKEEEKSTQCDKSLSVRVQFDEEPSDLASKPSYHGHRRSVSFPEAAAGLAPESRSLSKSRRKNKLPSIASLFSSNHSEKSLGGLRSSHKSVNSPVPFALQQNAVAQHDFGLPSEKGRGSALLSLNGSANSLKSSPCHEAPLPDERKSTDKQKTNSDRKPNRRKGLFPWRQKRKTNIEDLEKCFDVGNQHQQLVPKSTDSLSNSGQEATSTSKSLSVPFYHGMERKGRSQNNDDMPRIRKSMSLNDIDLKTPAFHHIESRPRRGRPFSGDVKDTERLHIMRYKGVTFVNEYALVSTLGRGSYGKVKLALSTIDSELYALKLMPKRRSRRMTSGLSGSGASSVQADECIQREIDLMKSLCHPNVIRLFEVIDDPMNSKLLLVMEYAEAGTLAPNKKRRSLQMTEILARRYFRDVLTGLDFLHFKSVSHSDLKPENLMLTADGSVKIGDLGSSHLATGLSKKTRGTPAFLSPEMCCDSPFDPMKGDVWALGACLYSFLYGTVPFKAGTIVGLYEAIRAEPLGFPSNVFISDSAKHLLMRLLEKDPEKRISLVAAMNHPWVTHNAAHLLPNCRGLESDEDFGPECWLMESWPLDPVKFSFQTLLKCNEHLLEIKNFKPGKYVVSQGDPLRSIFYVIEGEVEIVHTLEANSEDDDFDEDLEESLTVEQDPCPNELTVMPRSKSKVLRRVFHATRSAHQMLPSNSVKRLNEEAEESSTTVARRGPESTLVEAELIEKGLHAVWRTSVRAATKAKLGVISIRRLGDMIVKHPEIERDIRALMTSRIAELQKLVMIETLARLHADIEDEVCVNGVCPLWTRAVLEHDKNNGTELYE